MWAGALECASSGSDEDFPFRLETGRTTCQSRPRGSRAARLEAATPNVWVEIVAEDAERLGVAENDLVRVSTPHGSIDVPAKIGYGRPGVIFVPFHFGRTSDADLAPGVTGLRLSAWESGASQPFFKKSPARVERLANQGTTRPETPAPAVRTQRGQGSAHLRL